MLWMISRPTVCRATTNISIACRSYAGNTTSMYYFYMWRFGWVFYLMSLFFAVMAFFTGFLACCGRLGSALAGLVSLTALFFYTIAVSLMTYVLPLSNRDLLYEWYADLYDSATFVKARDAFRADNRTASIGTWAFGFSWGAWAALLIATVMFFLGTRRNDTGTTRTWRRTRSTRSRRSYDLGSHRVKDDYA